MKIKYSLRKASYIGLAVGLLGLSLVSTFSAAFPAKAGAATNSAAIVEGHPEIKCSPVLSVADSQIGGIRAYTDVSNYNNATNSRSLDRLAAGNFPSQPPLSKDTFAEVRSGVNILQVTFKGADGAANSDKACAGSLALFRKLDSRDPQSFWWGVSSCYQSEDTKCPALADLTVVDGFVDPKTNTVNFGLGNGAEGPLSLLNDPKDPIYSKYFATSSASSGAGNSTGGLSFVTCLEKYHQQRSLQPCLEGRKAKFIDFSHIELEGDIYQGVKWGGGHMIYELVRTDKNKDLQALSPKFDVNTENDQTDFNLDDGADKGQLTDFTKAIERSGDQEITIGIKFIADKASGLASTDMRGTRVVATYYKLDPKAPASDFIQIAAFDAGAGTNEKRFYGKYTRSDATSKTFTLQDGGYSGCGDSNRPRFELSSIPTGNGDRANASWFLQANNSPSCDVVTARVFITSVKEGEKAPPETGSNSGTDTTNDNDGPNCETPGFNLSWILCPIIDGMTATIDFLYDNMIKPLLETKPIDISNSSSDKSNIFEIWSSFRLLGDVILVVALVIIVYAQAIGGGVVDAYTAKKMLPRLLLAGVLINTSIYIVALAVDLTNIAGNGIAALLEAPFKSVTDGFEIHLSTDSTVVAGVAGGVGVAAVAASGFAAAAAVGGALVSFLLVFVLVPMLLILLAVLATVVFRAGLIILLVVTAPVAFALYCLPNTEKYFKQWWDTFFKTLLVYPIIAVLFALGNIMAVTVNMSLRNGSAPDLGFAADMVSVIALITPLFLIPFSFKLAGGIIGRVGDALQGYSKQGSEFWKGNQNDPYSRRNRARYKLGDANTSMREKIVGGGQREGAGRGRRAMGRAANWGNLQARRSMYNKQRDEMLQGQIATGDDSNIRDMFIAYDKDYVHTDKNGVQHKGAWFRRMDMENGKAVAGASAVYSGKSAFERGKAAQSKSQSLYKGDKSAVQSGLYYEWKKTSFDPAKMARVEKQYGEILKDNGLNNIEGQEMMKGVGFRHQGQSLMSKYSTFKSDKDGNWDWHRDEVGMAREMGYNITTFAQSNQDVGTYDTLGQGYDKMVDAGVHESWDGSQEVIQEGPLKGKSKGDVYEAYDATVRLAENMRSTPPRQGQPQPTGPDADGNPQFSYGGPQSSAPVLVAKAMGEFSQKAVRLPVTPKAPPKT